MRPSAEGFCRAGILSFGRVCATISADVRQRSTVYLRWPPLTFMFVSRYWSLQGRFGLWGSHTATT